MPAVRRIRLCAPPKADRSVKFNFKLMLRARRHTALRFWVELPCIGAPRCAGGWSLLQVTAGCCVM